MSRGSDRVCWTSGGCPQRGACGLLGEGPQAGLPAGPPPCVLRWLLPWKACLGWRLAPCPLPVKASPIKRGRTVPTSSHCPGHEVKRVECQSPSLVPSTFSSSQRRKGALGSALRLPQRVRGSSGRGRGWGQPAATVWGCTGLFRQLPLLLGMPRRLQQAESGPDAPVREIPRPRSFLQFINSESLSYCGSKASPELGEAEGSVPEPVAGTRRRRASGRQGPRGAQWRSASLGTGAGPGAEGPWAQPAWWAFPWHLLWRLFKDVGHPVGIPPSTGHAGR